MDRSACTPVNGTKPVATCPGDYVYRDQEKLLAWLDVRDCDAAKITLHTTNIILIVEGNRTTTRDYARTHITAACELMQKYCGGSYSVHALAP